MARLAADRIAVKRAYEPAAKGDGVRILVDRLWPRGVSKEAAAIDDWMKELAPSTELRKWFGHDPERWTEFRRRYAAELKDRGEALSRLRALATKGRITLVYAARDEENNDSVALRDILLGRA
jgi:uncharacterized protein YeaO (DUF488 family)